MVEQAEKPPIEPAKFFIRGLAVPGMIIAACAGVGAVISILNGNIAPVQIWDAVKTGAFVGFWLSLVGFIEIPAGLLLADRRFMNGVYMAAGYFAIWTIAAYALGFFNDRDDAFLESFGFEIEARDVQE